MPRHAPVTQSPSNGGVSFWHRQIGIRPPRPPLRSPATADVVIAGGGLTGLWTAYYLKQADPALDIVVLEREFCGFGASGRNGGWITAEFAGDRDRMAARHGRPGVVAMQQAFRRTVDEIIEVSAREGIDADLIKPGVLRVARGDSQLQAVRDDVARDREWEPAPADVTLLDRRESLERIRVDGTSGATYSPHCARAQPAKLVTGLAQTVERMGVRIYENTAVTALRPGAADTSRGAVRAPVVLSCLEAYTASLRGRGRSVLPYNNAVIVTDPIAPETWEQIGWAGRELLMDGAHEYVYAQRTADDRIAIGGRGSPYRFGSRTDRWGVSTRTAVDQLTAALHALLPQTRSVAVAHAWCGVLGIHRDWIPSVDFDPATGLGSAQGYVGEGMSTANLAGRTLRDLILKRPSELTRLPIVNRPHRDWEPEPLRFVGTHLVHRLYRRADSVEGVGRPARRSVAARVAARLSGA